MIPTRQIGPEELPLYAMQLLPALEMEELRAQLEHDPEAQRLLSETYDELAMLAYTVDMHPASAAARERFLTQIGREKKVVSAGPERGDAMPPATSVVPISVRRSPFARALPWLGWAVAAGLAVEAGFLSQQREKLQRSAAEQRVELAQTMSAAGLSNLMLATLRDPSAQNVVLTPGPGKIPPQGHATYQPGKGALIFLASNLEPLEPSKTYELWLLPADGHSPIPAGLFRPDMHGNAVVTTANLPQGTVAGGFGVTIEDRQGSATPTAPILLKGSAA